MKNEPNERDPVATLAELIRDVRIAMLTSVESDGALHSRPMATQQTDFDGTLWFFTDADAPKVREIAGERHVNVAYASAEENLYISVSGTAKTLRDQSKIDELWNPVHKAWFPGGKDDPNLALLKITVHRAEYWQGPTSKIIQFIGIAKAAVTGTRYNQGEDRKLNLDTGEVSHNLQEND